MKKLTFEKEDSGRWYIVLPDWHGHKDDLEMVAGADTLLDTFANGGKHVTLEVSLQPFDGAQTFTLQQLDPGVGTGAVYIHEASGSNFWLCAVTKFVLGDFPQTMYAKVVG